VLYPFVHEELHYGRLGIDGTVCGSGVGVRGRVPVLGRARHASPASWVRWVDPLRSHARRGAEIIVDFLRHFGRVRRAEHFARLTRAGIDHVRHPAVGVDRAIPFAVERARAVTLVRVAIRVRREADEDLPQVIRATRPPGRLARSAQSGSRIAARMAIIPITTSISTSVKPLFRFNI